MDRIAVAYCALALSVSRGKKTIHARLLRVVDGKKTGKLVNSQWPRTINFVIDGATVYRRRRSKVLLIVELQQQQAELMELG